MANIGKELKMKSFKSSYQKASLNIMFTGNWLMARTENILKPFGISQQQYNVLRILRGQGGELVNLFAIQERMLSRMSNATRLVEKLRQKGLVERQLCEANRRKVEISITKTGLELLEKIDPLLENIEEKHFKGISPEEAEKISDWLDKIRS